MTPTPTFRRVARIVAIVVASLVALVVTLYLVVNISGLVAAQGARAHLSEDLTRNFAEDLPSSRQRADTVAARVGSEPDHSWVAQACAFETDDAGWIVQSYRQVCALESVHAWQVDSEPGAGRLLGDLVQADEPPLESGPCVRYAVSRRLGEQEPFGKSRLELVWSAPSTTGGRWCLPSAGGYQQRRSVVGAVPTLDPSHGWLVAVQTDQLADEDLGCLHWSVILCDNPFGDEPAWGTPPA